MGERTRPRIGLGVALRQTHAGHHLHASNSDHVISVHAGPPVRSSCVKHRSVRQRGDISMMPAGTSDTWFDDEASASLDLRVPTSLLRSVAEEMGLAPERAGIEPRYEFRDGQIEHIAWALEAESRAGFPNGLLYTDSLGTALAVHLLGRYAAPTPDRSGLTPVQVRRVKEYVEEHLDETLSLVRLARVAGVSASHFKTLFKRTMGVPVHEYVVQRRVERARVLLQQGELPATQIALDVGFSHQSHMARWMRRVLGVTPTSVARSRAV